MTSESSDQHSWFPLESEADVKRKARKLLRLTQRTETSKEIDAFEIKLAGLEILYDLTQPGGANPAVMNIFSYLDATGYAYVCECLGETALDVLDEDPRLVERILWTNTNLSHKRFLLEKSRKRKCHTADREDDVEEEEEEEIDNAPQAAENYFDDGLDDLFVDALAVLEANDQSATVTRKAQKIKCPLDLTRLTGLSGTELLEEVKVIFSDPRRNLLIDRAVSGEFVYPNPIFPIAACLPDCQDSGAPFQIIAYAGRPRQLIGQVLYSFKNYGSLKKLVAVSWSPNGEHLLAVYQCPGRGTTEVHQQEIELYRYLPSACVFRKINTGSKWQAPIAFNSARVWTDELSFVLGLYSPDRRVEVWSFVINGSTLSASKTLEASFLTHLLPEKEKQGCLTCIPNHSGTVYLLQTCSKKHKYSHHRLVRVDVASKTTVVNIHIGGAVKEIVPANGLLYLAYRNPAQRICYDLDGPEMYVRTPEHECPFDHPWYNVSRFNIRVPLVVGEYSPETHAVKNLECSHVETTGGVRSEGHYTSNLGICSALRGRQLSIGKHYFFHVGEESATSECPKVNSHVSMYFS